MAHLVGTCGCMIWHGIKPTGIFLLWSFNSFRKSHSQNL